MLRLDQIEAIFHEARLLPAGPDRQAWIEQQCRGDRGAIDEVVSLLEAHTELSRAEPVVKQPESHVPSTQFGAYQAEELVGRGGTSIVYRARRADGRFEQTVALKIMAAYLAGPEFLRRFEIERQVLASLSHHNITSLLDGGVSSNGDPYLITEYVDGVTIDHFCDSGKLNVDARLRVFLQVCDAVDYAHRNLVVHRDLKPGNILVNSEGVVKLLDFGTASILAGERDVTVTRMRMMTPRYASPEQLRGERVSTATDIFSLGVILYELLCGAWPFGDPTSNLIELTRATSDVKAKSPSTSVTEQAAERRSASREHLRRVLRGDLATIALKMLASEPAARYESVRQAAEDIQRYLSGRPVLARPHSAWYSARKFVGRHWIGVSAATFGVLALAALSVVSLYQSVQARKQATRAQRVSEFAKNTFISASSTWTSPLRGQSRAIQFNDILDNAADRVGKELADDPVAEADLRGTLGATYSILGDTAKGEEQILLAIERLNRSNESSPVVAIQLQQLLCNTRSYQGRYVEALAACREAVALRRTHSSPVALGFYLHDMAFMSVKSGTPLAEAEELYREALANGPSDPAHARLWPAIVNTRIGALRLRLGDLKDGRRLLEESERGFRNEPGPPIEIVPALVALAHGARIEGKYSEALRRLDEAIALLTARPTAYLGRDTVEIELAAVEALAGRPHASSDLPALETRLAREQSAADRVRYDLLSGIVEAHGGSKQAAENYYRSALSIGEKELPRQSSDRVEIYVRLADLLAATGRASEAADVARRGLVLAEPAYGRFFAGHPLVAELRRHIR